MEKITHYSQIYDEWLKPEDLQGKAFTVTIHRAYAREFYNVRSREEEIKLVLDFGRKKHLICNPTQASAAKQIVEQQEGVGDPDVLASWKGTKIQIAAGVAPNRKATIVISPPPVVDIAKNDDVRASGPDAAEPPADTAENDDVTAEPKQPPVRSRVRRRTAKKEDVTAAPDPPAAQSQPDGESVTCAQCGEILPEVMCYPVGDGFECAACYRSDEEE